MKSLSTKLSTLSISILLAACGGGSSNTAPDFTSTNYAFSLDEDSVFSGSVEATDTDAVSYTIASAASNGIFALEANGAFSYTPATDFYGEDTVIVQASDGDLSSQAELVFTVTNINDAPQLLSTTLTVTTGGTSTGSINVEDADGDAITFTLVTQPEVGAVTLDSATGEYSYSTEELDSISGSFMISYTDGIIDTPLEAEVALTPSYATNTDKLNYYYASDASHLKQAQAITAMIDDDVTLNSVNADLATGYMVAGFDDIATDLLAGISSLEDKSSAYRKAANALDQLGDTAGSLSLRTQSELALTQYIAQKGLENLNSDDAGLYLSLVGEYLDAGQTEEANALLDTLSLLTESLVEEEYTTIYGNFLSAYTDYAQSNVNLYLNDTSDENYARAQQAIDILAQAAESTGYQAMPWWSEFADQNSYLEKALHIMQSGVFALFIGDDNSAKAYTNYALSFIGVASYDEEYVYDIPEQYQATLSEAQFDLHFLPKLSGLISNYYPEADTNAAFDLITYSSDEVAANVNIYSGQLVADLQSDSNIDEATASAESYFTNQFDWSGNASYTELYQSMVESDHDTPNAARLLFSQGYSEQAINLLEHANAILVTENYINNAKYFSFGQMTHVSGRLGCARATALMAEFGGDALAQATACETMTDTYLTTEAGFTDTSGAIKAYSHLMSAFYFADDVTGVTRTYTKLAAEIALLDSKLTQASETLLGANYLLKYGAPEEAIAALTLGLDYLKEAYEADESGDVLAEAPDTLRQYVYNDELAAETANYFVVESFMLGLKAYPGKIDNYAELYTQVNTLLATHAAFYTEKVLELSDLEILAEMENLITINFAIGDITTVDSLIAREVNTEAEVASYLALKAGLYATQNGFAATNVASVDTDNDGMPNFFLDSATEEDIAESGLTADDDADNDGIADATDPSPLN